MSTKKINTMKKDLEKDDVQPGQFFILSPNKGYMKSQTSTAMQVVECWDKEMTVKTKKGILTKPYEEFEEVKNLTKFKSIAYATYFEDHRPDAYRPANCGGIPIKI